MKAALCLFFVFGPYMLAEEPADRAAIERAIAGLNEFPRRAALFTQDSNASDELARLPEVVPREWRGLAPPGDAPRSMVTISHEPWGEATIGFAIGHYPWAEILNPRISGGAVTFITSDVALSDGNWTYNDGAKPQSIPIFFVLKKEGAEWKIASLRVLAPR